MKSVFQVLGIILSAFILLAPNRQVDIPKERLPENEEQVYEFLLSLSDSIEAYSDLFQHVMEHLVRANTIEIYSVEKPDIYSYECFDFSPNKRWESQQATLDSQYSFGKFLYPYQDVGNNDSSYCATLRTITAPILPYMVNVKELLETRLQPFESSKEFLEKLYELKRHASDHLLMSSNFSRSNGSNTSRKRNLFFSSSDLIQEMLSENVPMGTADLYEIFGDFRYENPEYYVRVRIWNSHLGILSPHRSMLKEKDIATKATLFAEEVNTSLEKNAAVYIDVEIRNLHSNAATFYGASYLL